MSVNNQTDFTFKSLDPAGLVPSPGEKETAAGLEKLRTVCQGQECYAESLGWHRTSEWSGEEWLSRYEELAARIRADADAFVVVGIGGSNQAARAVVEALEPVEGAPEIVWAGNSLSPHSINGVIEHLRGKKSVYIDVIAKNFETLEPGAAFRALRTFLRDTYGEGWQKRVVTTGTIGSHFEDISKEHGFTFIPFPSDVGGRFTALAPVGLLPLAVAGFDIRALARGAADMEAALKGDMTAENPALRYALQRNAAYKAGYRMEMLSFFEPRFFRFSKWWVQLFGESEGKDGLGLYPVAGSFSEDLHSIGQFLQDGTRCIMETFIDVKEQDSSLVLRADEVDDRFGYLDGMDYHQMNKAAFTATVDAHSRVMPCNVIEVEKLGEYAFGKLFYFFMFSCYLSGLILGVNPFDQPGVEAYKQGMFKILGK